MAVKDSLKVASVQFEMAENDKEANLKVMERFIAEAGKQKVDVISFPELCLAGYHFHTRLSKKELLGLAEPLSDSPSLKRLHAAGKKAGVAVLFGILELADNEKMYNTYIAVTPEEGLIHSHRKVHAFENSAILQGDKLEVFSMYGWTCGILICYDNNLIENTRVLALKGAEIIFAPHQTGGFDIERAGMGRIPLDLWRNREKDPEPMRKEALGPKGREWLMKWLPSRSYDNNVFTVFANGVGIDGPEVRPGLARILDPEGMVLAETAVLGDDMVIADLRKEARQGTLAGSHVAARRPSLYAKISEPAPEMDTRSLRNKMSGEKII